MFIDIHGHTRLFQPPALNGVTHVTLPEELIKRYDTLGIERAVLLPVASPGCIIDPQSTEEILEASRQYKGRFIPFCNVDPRAINNTVDAPLGDWLRHYADKGCKGIGEVTANMHILDPKVQNLFKHVQDVGFPLTFHLSPTDKGGFYGLVDEPGLPGLELSMQRFPELKFFGHSQTFWAEMAVLETVGDRNGYPDYPVSQEGALPKLMRKYPNLYGDLSAGSGHNALARDVDYAIKFLNEFQDRLMFGTDICAPGTPTPLIDFLLELRNSKKIPENVFQKVARENAIKLLNLDEKD